MPQATASFGQWLRQQRKALDLTQEALGKLVSCSPHAIRKIEADERRPSRRLTDRLGEHLRISSIDQPAFFAAARGVLAQLSTPVQADVELCATPTDAAPAPMPFVGRVAQERILRTRLAQLPSHRGRTVIVEGEAGIGKTRLVVELSRHAQRSNLRVASRKCYQIERNVAYRSLVDLIEQAVSTAPAGFEQRLNSVARAEIAALVPALAGRWDGLPTLSADVPQARQVRLTAAAVSLFEVLSEPDGLLLVLDDLQWIDDASAQVLLSLAAHASRSRFLLVLACRSEDLRADAPLAQLVAEFESSGPFERMALPALTRAELQDLLQRLRATATPAAQTEDGFTPSAVDAIYAYCHGNPLFLAAAIAEGPLTRHSWHSTETLHDGVRRSLPAQVQSVMRGRLKRLSQTARQLIDVAAVIGRGADFELLHAVLSTYSPRRDNGDAGRAEFADARQAVAGGTAPALCLDALDELMLREWLIVDDETDEYTFVHDSMREAVLTEMSSARRNLLHATVAASLVKRDDQPHALIAEHEEEARHWTAALRHRTLAGAQAEQVFAVQEAVSHYSRGMALAERHTSPATSALASELLERRGLAYAWLSAVDRADADLRPAVANAIARNDTSRAVELLTALGMTYQRADRYAQGTETLNQALSLARQIGDHKAMAVAMFWLGDIQWSLENNAASSVWFEQVMEVCRSARLGDDVWIKAHHGLGEVAVLDARPQQALVHFTRSLALARQHGDARLECENLIVMAWAHLGAHGTSQYDAALAHCDEVLALVKKADMPWYLAPALIGQGAAQCALGRFQESLGCLEQSIAIARDIGMTRFEAMARLWLAECCLDAEQPGRALAHAERARRLMDESGVCFFSHHLHAVHAQALLRLGRMREVPDLAQVMSEARSLLLGHAVLRIFDTRTEWFFVRADLESAERNANEWAETADTHGVPEMRVRAAAWSARLLAERGDFGAALHLAEQLLAQKQAGVRFSLNLALSRLASRCTDQLNLPSAATYRERVSILEDEIERSRPAIEALSPSE